MKGSFYRVIASVLIIFGVAVNFLPAASYYFGTYVHVPHRGSIVVGSTLDFYTFVGTFYNNKTGQSFDVGLALNITYLGDERYGVNYTVYKLLPSGEGDGLNPKLLPRFPFWAAGGVFRMGSGHGAVNSKSTLIRVLMPVKPLPEWHVNGTVHTFPNKFYGFPKVIIVRDNSTPGMYALYGGGRPVAINIMPNSTSFLSTLFARSGMGLQDDSTVSPTVAVFLGGGNTVPTQDWAGWLKYGFGISFPLNVGFIIIGILMLIVASRRA
jgi:hypothetical protein